jgi:hypothetical protein
MLNVKNILQFCYCLYMYIYISIILVIVKVQKQSIFLQRYKVLKEDSLNVMLFVFVTSCNLACGFLET